MQWFKGSQKIKEGAKFTVKYIECGENEYEVMLEIAVRKTFLFGCISYLYVILFQRLLRTHTHATLRIRVSTDMINC